MQLGLPAAPIYPILELGVRLDADQWAVQEFGAADLEHKARTDHLVKSVDLPSRSPGKSVTKNIEMSRSAVAGYYPFLKRPDTETMTPRILSIHRVQTTKRMRGEDTVLCVIDETRIS